MCKSLAKYTAWMLRPCHHQVWFIFYTQAKPSCLLGKSGGMHANHTAIQPTHAMHEASKRMLATFCFCQQLSLCTQLIASGMCWKNGTRCRDGAQVLLCCFYIVWFAFWNCISTCGWVGVGGRRSIHCMYMWTWYCIAFIIQQALALPIHNQLLSEVHHHFA